MTEQTKKVTATDVNSNFEDVSLWKLRGHKPTLEILRRTSLQYSNDKSEGLHPKLPSILISSDSRGLGAETLARAFSASIGNKFKILLAETLGYDSMIQSIFLDEPDDTTIYIPSAQDIIHLAQQRIYTIIKEQILTYTTFDRKIVKVPFKNRLIILGTTNEHILISSLLHAIDIRVSLVSYSFELLMSILKQRIEYLCWTVRSEEVLSFLINESDGSVGKAMSLLGMSYRVMKSKNKDILETEHIATANIITTNTI